MIDKFHYSLDFCKRLREAYLKIYDLKKIDNNNDNIWHKFDQLNLDIHNNFIKSDNAVYEFANTSILEHNLYLGTTNLCKNLVNEKLLEEYGARILQAAKENILKILYEIGIINKNVKEEKSLDDMLILLDNFFNFKIIFPIKNITFNHPRGFIDIRNIIGIYYAYKIFSLLKNFGPKTNRILEIGGGVGHVPLYLSFFGIKSFTGVDTLFGIIRQALYLSSILGEDKIIFFGDDNITDKIRLLSEEQLILDNSKYDLCFNADSFTEIDTLNALNYSSFIKHNCNIFYSINHESNKFFTRDFFNFNIRYSFPLNFNPTNFYFEEIFLNFK